LAEEPSLDALSLMSFRMHSICADADTGKRALIAGTVVLYHPSSVVIGRLLEYSGYFDFLILVDNTERVDLSPIFACSPNIAYMPLYENRGVATALNIAATTAISKRFRWLIMLDQDSNLQSQTFLSIKEAIQVTWGTNIAVLSPVQVSNDSDSRQLQARPLTREIARTMTSGSALSLHAYEECGPFEDKLFIDHIDNEYCFRLRRHGFRILQLAHLSLEHALGELETTNLIGFNFKFTTHKPFRSYYFVRNGLYVGFKFILFSPTFLPLMFFQFWKDVVKALLFQHEKALRLKMMFLGLLHFCTGRYGPL
jgi:rhamnosyltransferase